MHVASLKFDTHLLSLVNRQESGFLELLSAGGQVGSESISVFGRQEDEIKETIVGIGFRRQVKVGADEFRVHRLQQQVIPADILPVDDDLEAADGIAGAQFRALSKESTGFRNGIGNWSIMAALGGHQRRQ